MPPRLELRGIVKRFPGVLANDGIDLAVAPGEIHALLGENGAGKSTLVKIVYGVLQPDAGEILIDGRPVAMRSPHDARRLGIAMVFQHFTLFEAMTVLENVALALEDEIPFPELERRLLEVGARYGLELAPRREVHGLSVGERQRLEVVRCLLQEPRLLIMDEPTSVLTPQEAEALFRTLARIAAAGTSILYISHRLQEVVELCDRATILRGGRVVATVEPRRERVETLARLMVGEEVREPVRAPQRLTGRAPALEVENLSLPADHPFGVALREISFTLHRGEILGIAGVAGNGQRELVEALSGERLAPRPQSIRIHARPIGHLDVAGRRRLGLCTLPEERLGHAAVGELTLAENALLSAWPRLALTRLGWIRPRAVAAFAGEIVRRFDVRTPGLEVAAASLSGGNLQKFVVGREILQHPEVLVVAQPTWGIDAAAAAAVHRDLVALAEAGTAVLLVSQDLDELFMLADRIAVLHAGRLFPPMRTRDVDLGRIGLMMAGIDREAESV